VVENMVAIERRTIAVLALLICYGIFVGRVEGQTIPPELSTEALSHGDQIKALRNDGRYAEAHQAAERFISGWERRRYPALAAWVRSVDSRTYEEQLRYDDAERQVLAALQQLGNPPRYDDILSDVLSQLGSTHYRQRRFVEAEKDYRRAMAVIKRRFGRDSNVYALQLSNLANVLTDSGRFLEGVPLYHEAIAIHRRHVKPDALELANAYQNLGITLQVGLGRREEAEPYLVEALRIHTRHRQAIPVAEVLLTLAKGQAQASNWEKARAILDQRLNVLRDHYGKEHPLVVDQTALGDLYLMQNRLAEAEQLYRDSLASCAEAFGEGSEQYCTRLCVLAFVLDQQGKEVEAEEIAGRAIELAEKLEGNWELLAQAYEHRASPRSDQQRYQDAIADYRKAVDLAALSRSQLAGSDIERAQLFSNSYRGLYVNLAWHLLQVGEEDEAFLVAERGRGRSLADEMELAHADLLAGLPNEQAVALRARERQAVERLTDLEQRLPALANAPRDEQPTKQRKLYEELALARRQLVDANTAIRNASPLYRRVLAKNAEPIRRDALEAWLVERRYCLLYYTLSDYWSFVVVYGAGPREEPSHFLELSPAQAQTLGLKPGRPNDPELSKAFLGKEGLLAQLASPKGNAAAAPKLAALWEVLVPADIRAALARGDYAGLIVVPDGSLSLLPFEALVVEAEGHPKYLLDVGPPVCYAPSATLFYHLANRSIEGKQSPPSLLTVGDAVYDLASTTSSAASARSRFSALSGPLARLPYTANESHWIKQALGEAGLSTRHLLARQATEANLRKQLGGHQIVHLACHGLADESLGNFFGALALTPGATGTRDTKDDGFLTLAEISGLDLRENELTVLSACQTNFGPQQHGEGVWALTRGFLVSGSRRVVASDWVVDDQAAAYLVSYFGKFLAKDYKRSRPPAVAAALRDAKRQIRKEDKWKAPYYWAPFVLVGAD
jgi:CHAT domain-containing protein/tetratricopeptide (TPR) repeat protein